MVKFSLLIYIGLRDIVIIILSDHFVCRRVRHKVHSEQKDSIPFQFDLSLDAFDDDRNTLYASNCVYIYI